MSRPDIDDPELTLRMLFDRWPAAAALFMGRGMACLGCPVAPFHGVADACREYGLDEAAFRAALRDCVAGRAPNDPGRS